MISYALATKMQPVKSARLKSSIFDHSHLTDV